MLITLLLLFSSLFCASLSHAASCGGHDCGAASCCIDQQNGAQCYSPITHTCLLSLQGNKLCGVNEGACGTYPLQFCYAKAQYDCVNNQLVYKGASASGSTGPATTAKSTTATATTSSATTAKTTSSSSTGKATTGASATTAKTTTTTAKATTSSATTAKATTGSSTTTKATTGSSTTAKATTGSSTTAKATTGTSTTAKSTTGTSTTGYGNNICGGINCGRDLCCVIQSGEGICYKASEHTCSNGVLCPAGMQACGAACYSPTQYSCVGGQLQPTGGVGTSSTTAKSTSTSAKSTSTSAKSTSTSGKSSTTSGTTGGGVKQVKIWGLNYSPKRPSGACPALADVEADVRILATLTSRIRLYSIVDCDQGQLVLRAIQNTGVQLTVTLGMWLDTYHVAEFANERAGLINLINNVGLDLVDDVIVGSETQYRQDFPWTVLTTYMQNVTDILTGYGYTDIDVVTVDIIYTMIGNDLVRYEDIVYVNQFPFWEGAKFEDSVELVLSTIDRLRRYVGSKPIIIGETGWPTNGSNYQYAVPSENYLNQYLHALVCEFDRQNLGYFWFEAFDEPYKVAAGGKDKGVEKHWGLYTGDRVKKPGVVLPVVCPV